MERLRRHLEEIITVGDDEFERIASYFTLKKVRKHQFLLEAGDMVEHEYLVCSGIFRMIYLGEDGKEHIVQFAGENWWMSDYNAFFNRQPGTLEIVCMEAGEVLCLTLDGREQLAAEMHAMEHFFRVKLTKGYAALQRRIISLLSSTPQERYEEFRRLYPHFMQKIPKKYIAEYLGVSRETLSRLYSK